MKKIAFTLFAALFVFALQAQAQVRVGVRAGLNMATWGGDAVENFSSMIETSEAFRTEMNPSFHAGAYVNVPLSEVVSLEPGLFYSGKGLRMSQSYFSNNLLKPQATITDNAHYIEMPVLVRVNLGPGFQLFAGPQVSYLAQNEIRAEAGLLGASYGYDWKVDAGLRKFDFGVTGGIGYAFTNGLNMQAGYEWGLTSLDEGRSNVDAYNRVIKVSMGYTFGR
jgi:hypothetical protein